MQKNNPFFRYAATRHRQRGVWLLLAMMILLLAVTGVLTTQLITQNKPENSISQLQVLNQAKDTLLGYVLSIQGGSRLGQFPNPDQLDTVADDVPAQNYDGKSQHGCISRTWVVGQPTLSIGALGANARCLGRFPWQTLGYPIPAAAQNMQQDVAGIMSWYAVSSNLVDTACPLILNPGILAATPSNSCFVGAQPFPWMTVVDAKGNVLSNRVAVVILLPGTPLQGQNRTAAPLANASAYLDSVTVRAGCQAPCVPGTYNNAQINLANNIALRFIQGLPTEKVSASDTNYTQPYRFNDQLVFITIDELMATLKKRAVQESTQPVPASWFATNVWTAFP
jgi:hypothetical protein